MEWVYETDKWPFVKARYFKNSPRKRKIRLVVIHSMESPEKGDTAEATARDFQTTSKEKSAHICVDNNSIVQCVLDNDIAWAAPGANFDGIQVELAGYAKQRAADWHDPYSTLVLEKAANAVAQYCLKYTIPVRQLSNAELGDGKTKGIVGHAQVSEVFKESDHTDPGVDFPWDYFLRRVNVFLDKRRTA